MDSIEMVFFDAAGTLFDVRGRVGEIYARIARKYGVDANSAKLESGFRRAFPKQPPMAFASELNELELAQLEKQWWHSLVREVFAGVPDFTRFDEYFDEVFDLFRTPIGWELYDETISVLDALHSRGLKIGMISNFDSRVFDVLRAFDLEKYFSGVHISSRIGAAKPDAAIFQAALAAHKIEPEQALHVGDSLRDDALGASAVGMNALWLDRRDRGSNENFPFRITHLGELITGHLFNLNR
ncbi:MAG TPA: HAD-IA family hydrolase [Blastocatellia bacterium]|nr:HAD-IA family hydrolase [Blastocatellia bacterium]